MNRSITLLRVCLLVCVVSLGLARAQSANASFERRFETIKKTATKEQLYRFLYAMPKGGDLHNHLGLASMAEDWWAAATDPRRNHGNTYYTRLKFNDCSDSREPMIRFRTIQRATYARLSPCAKAEYVPLADLTPAQKAEWLSSLKLDRPGKGRNDFFEVITQRLGDLLRDPWIMASLLVDNLKLYGAQGLRYLETQTGNGRSMQDQDGKPVEAATYLQLLRTTLASPEAKATGVTVRFLQSLNRFSPEAEDNLERAYAFVDQNRDLWVGVNIVGREDNGKGSPARLLETFRKLRRTYSGIQLSLHAGETDDANLHVRQTLLLGATRIGHGINLITDPDTLLLLQGGRVLVEINLISNRLLEYTPDLSRHPFPEYLRTGIPVCLNTDDPGVWDSDLTDEYFTAVTQFNLTWDELVQMGRDSLGHAFVEPAVKQRLLEAYARDVAAFEGRLGGTDWAAALTQVKPRVTGYAERTFGLPRP